MYRPYSSVTLAWRMFILVVTVSTMAAGCGDGFGNWVSELFDSSSGRVETLPGKDPLSDSAAYRDSIAERAYFDGLRRLRVRGYGLVVGLGRNGSTQCPKSVADQLKQEMYKTRKFAERRGQHVTPERLLKDSDTAVVAVEGEISAAATAGERFDLVVRAIPGTDTVSLEGGTLFECNLQIFRPLGPTGWIPGKAIAVGAGPVFLNPFGRTDDAATKPNLRDGIVIGGGVADEDRRLRLLLTTPSYQMSTRIADVINDRFSNSGSRVADAVSPSQVKVIVPARYRHEPKHFISVVQHLYPAVRAEFVAERARQLAREFTLPDAPHADIALAWEGIGRNALPIVQEFYDHAQPACSFHSAAVGLRLGDDAAIEIIESHLLNPNSEFRMAAIVTLGAVRDSRRAARPLRRALDDGDVKIRTAAYEALVQRDDPTITSIDIAKGAFRLDLVPTHGAKMVYVKRRGSQRIALFGGPMSARAPLFYSSPEESLMISALEGATHLTVVRTSVFTGVTSPPIQADFDVAKLIVLLGQNPPNRRDQPVRGLGIHYEEITRTLAGLCRAGSIDARFLLESADEYQRLRRKTSGGRRESDL